MANRTLKEARNVHGTNPQYLVEKIIRSRIYDSKYWKEQCFALTAELMVDKAMELRYIGGVFGGNIKPTPFLCLILKMLQIQPEKDIVVEFIRNEEFKYVRALGAFYLRLTGTSIDCYKYLEPLYNDFRKLRRQNRMGHFEIVFMDDFIDELLRNDRVCDIILPRIQKRHVLEENNEIEPKVSALDEDLDDLPSDDEAGVPGGLNNSNLTTSKVEKIIDLGHKKHKNKRQHQSRSKSRSPSPHITKDRYERDNRNRLRDDKERERQRREREREHREREREHEYGRGRDKERDRRDKYNRQNYDIKKVHNYDDYDNRRSDERRRERDRRRY